MITASYVEPNFMTLRNEFSKIPLEQDKHYILLTETNNGMTRFAFGSGATLRSRVLNLQRSAELANIVLGVSHIYGPFVDDEQVTGVMRAWRFVANVQKQEMWVDKAGQQVKERYEASVKPFALNVQLLEAIDINNLPSVSVKGALTGRTKKRKVNTLTINHRQSISLTPTNQATMYHTSGMIQLLPPHSVPVFGYKEMIRNRVLDYLDLTAKTPFKPTSEEIHLTWLRLWSIYDRIYHTRHLATHSQLRNAAPSYKESILQMVARMCGDQELGHVYSFACYLYFKYPEMPQLTNLGVVSEKDAQCLFAAPSFVAEELTPPGCVTNIPKQDNIPRQETVESNSVPNGERVVKLEETGLVPNNG